MYVNFCNASKAWLVIRGSRKENTMGTADNVSGEKAVDDKHPNNPKQSVDSTKTLRSVILAGVASDASAGCWLAYTTTS